MFQTLINVFRIKELRNKILFTLAMLVVFRIGHWIPLPGINQLKLKEAFENLGDQSALAKVTQYVATFSGGALSHSTIFGLGIMPYITAGIVFQLLSSAYPPLKKIQDEGPTGRQKIQEWTRYATIGLCLFQASAWLMTLRHMDFIYPEALANPIWWVMAVLALTAGTAFLMWLGEQIDKYGIGNGVSMIIMAGILATMPTALMDIYQSFEPGTTEAGKLGTTGLLGIAGGFVLVVAGSVLMTVAQRRIPVQQAKHTRGRKVFGGQRSFLPLRINHGGVMPVVFASTLMLFPLVIFTGLHEAAKNSGGDSWFFKVTQWLTFAFNTGEYLYVLLYIAMVYFFSYFWITVQFNPEDMSKQLKEHGSFIPGLRPGPRTAEYLETVMTRITYVGGAFLAIIAITPLVVNKSLGVRESITHFLGGTALLIVVSVTMDFLQRIEANLLMRNYQGFLSSGEEMKSPRIRGVQS
ncbi:MAG: preprotein translocase subunit SecY [Phycisphaeraceae bacterium]|nr:MAG: preprotein translocase subunit SecY [Phycisphaeraceae bacterium]